MGYYNGKRIPDGWDPWWEERETPPPEHEAFYFIGYEDGLAEGLGDGESKEKLKRRISQLEDLLSANVRVIKEELKKELEWNPTSISD